MNLLLDNPICSGHLYCVNTGHYGPGKLKLLLKVLFELGFDKGWDFLLSVLNSYANEFTNEHIMQNQKRILQQEEDS